MQQSDIVNEWKRAEVQLHSLLKELVSKYTRRKIRGYFYARWMTGCRIPEYLRVGLNKNNIHAVTRFGREQEINEEYFLRALNLLLRKHGFLRLRSHVTLAMVSTAVKQPIVAALNLKNATGLLTNDQIAMLEKIAMKYSGKSVR